MDLQDVLDRIDAMNKVELVTELRKLNLPKTGNKHTVKKRLKDFLIGKLNERGCDDQADLDGNLEKIQAIDEIDGAIKERERELELLKNRRLEMEQIKRQLNFTDQSKRPSVFDVDEQSEIGYQINNDLANNVRRAGIRNDMADGRSGNHVVATNLFSFRDIEHSMNTFSGNDNYHVEFFIKEFEQQAKMLRWNEDQKIVYAKRLLRGQAKILTRTIFISCWNELKKELLAYFGEKLTCNEAHKLLQSTKKKNNEEIGEYVLKMREIGLINGIDEVSTVQYIIEGIDDTPLNKAMLYGCKSYIELKEKLRAYDKFRLASGQKKETKAIKATSANESKATEAKSTNGATKKESKADGRCFLCGDSTHFSASCPTKEKGVKCFRCNSFGHKASDNVCSKTNVEKKVDPNKVMCLVKPKSMKEVEIGTVKMDALIDTGSDINAIREYYFKKLKIKTTKGLSHEYKGAGGAFVSVREYFIDEVVIDGEKYKTKIYVVDDEQIPVDLVIGNELLYDVELNMNHGKISIKKCDDGDKKEESEENFMMSITLGENEFKESLPSEVQKMIDDYKPEKPKNTQIELKIHLTDDTPIFRRPRRLAYSEKKIVDEQIEEWIKEGIVEEASSDYASCVVVTKKKDGSNRVCIDYRSLNKKIIKDRFPTPLIEDILDGLKDAKVFSSIDLKNGFFHVPVNVESQKYLAFVTHNGQYIFKKAPFGCCNSPAAFQRFIKEVFRELIKSGIVLVYMDDVVVLANDEKEAIQRLKMVLDCASKAGLIINWKKCQFLQRSIEFLGHLVENGTVKPSTRKVSAVQNFPEPKTIKQLQSFLGLTGAFRKFIKDYAVIAKPLSDILRKNNEFKFDQKLKTTFETLKFKLSNDPVLRLYNQDAETILMTDASKFGFGMILMQRDDEDDQFHPIYYASTKTSETEEKYDSYTLETLAVVKALEKFRTYLLGKKFKIITDCQAFEKTMQKQDIIPKIARWVMQLQDFDYEVEHRAGNKMQHVDALSRNLVMPIISKKDNLAIKVKKLQEEDDEIQRLKIILQQQPDYENFMVRNEILFKYINGCELLVVPKAMQSEVIKSVHENGHFATKKVEEMVKQQFYMDKLKEKIQKVINNCVPCILMERKHGKGEGFLHPIDKGDQPLDTYHIDHIGPMVATAKMYKYLFVVIDAFTKFVWIYPTKTTNAKEVLDKLALQQQSLGNPRRIISDKGSAFTSDEFKRFCDDERIEHVFTTTGLPRANGQVERINRCIIPILSKLALNDPSKWFKHVPALQRALNSSFQRSIATTPFKLLFGVEMKQKDDIKIRETLEENFVQQFEDQRKEDREAAKVQIKKVQEENSKNFNKKRKQAKIYALNELVAIKRTQFINGNKLAENFFGPYKITKIKSNGSFDVKKVGYHSGPNITSTTIEYLKKWSSGDD